MSPVFRKLIELPLQLLDWLRIGRYVVQFQPTSTESRTLAEVSPTLAFRLQ
jgi:hypothetical protein